MLYSKIICDCAEETAAHSELRRADPDAAAVAQFVDFIEEINNVETDFETPGGVGNFHVSLKRDVHGRVIGNALGISKPAAQSAAVKKIAGEFPVLPGVSASDGGSPTLVVIEEHPMFINVGVFVGIEEELR